MSQEYVDNYTKSKTATLPTLSFSTITKKEYTKGRELENISEKELQRIADAICCEFSVPTILINFKDRQPHKSDGKKITEKTQGIYQRTNFGNEKITVYKYTASRKQQRSPKGAISTLVHELCHYFDFRVIGLTRSPHTGNKDHGFYGRIRQLTDMLS